MELEPTGHQVAKYRSTHSFHVSGFTPCATQESKGLRGPRGRLPAWGASAPGSVTEPPGMRPPPRAAPDCGGGDRTRAHDRGRPSDTLSCRFSEKKR